MKWPRGRWNGMRIVGIECRARIDVLFWGFCLPDRYGRCLHVGPVMIWLHASYDERSAAPAKET